MYISAQLVSLTLCNWWIHLSLIEGNTTCFQAMELCFRWHQSAALSDAFLNRNVFWRRFMYVQSVYLNHESPFRRFWYKQEVSGFPTPKFADIIVEDLFGFHFCYCMLISCSLIRLFAAYQPAGLCKWDGSHSLYSSIDQSLPDLCRHTIDHM